MDEYIYVLRYAAVFSTLHANCDYWQVEIENPDRDKTALTYNHGLYRFGRMPLGLQNVRGSTWPEIDVQYGTIRCQDALVYMDDVVIFSKSAADHIGHAKSVLTLLHEAGVTLQLNKCVFFCSKIANLGHLI